jgi:putative (di)nucleoside polyphosphate hydrolase
MVFERVDNPGSWQLPQGGLHPDEQPVEAAWRELGEETGLGPREVRLVAELPYWTVYEWPGEMVADKQRRTRDARGQAHKWFVFEVLSESVEPTPDGNEFGRWKWVTQRWLMSNVVAWRGAAYQQGFAQLRSYRPTSRP